MRTTVNAVQSILGPNYDYKFLPDLTQFIEAAGSIVDTAVPLAASRGFTLSTSQQELVERWLAAYFYCKQDALYQQKNTDKASATFVTSQSLQSEQERYKRGAIELEPSGVLNALLNRLTARMTWLGKPVSQQIPYRQRD